MDAKLFLEGSLNSRLPHRVGEDVVSQSRYTNHYQDYNLIYSRIRRASRCVSGCYQRKNCLFSRQQITSQRQHDFSAADQTFDANRLISSMVFI